MSSSCRARITRTAISPRLATRTLRNTRLDSQGPAVERLELEQQLAVLDGLRVGDVDPTDDRVDLRLDLVHQLHRLQDAQNLARRHGITLLDERRRPRARRPVE